jgi:hypothetical protein
MPLQRPIASRQELPVRQLIVLGTAMLVPQSSFAQDPVTLIVDPENWTTS